IKCGDIDSHWENETKHIDNNCNGELVETPISKEEFAIICCISMDNEFLQAMIDLKEKDIIEYNLKMSQFKAQLQQQKSNAPQSGSTVHCPRCGSTNITAGQRGYSLLTGFVGSGSTVNRCANCGHKWKP
ncbi:MAG: hypothetical protein K2N39_11430, partial [Lachnospiraceae bacterium]|nr:hypothetical protein [Lachnospiraceae bacterium]